VKRRFEKNATTETVVTNLCCIIKELCEKLQKTNRDKEEVEED
jgi:hypothetical protein